MNLKSLLLTIAFVPLLTIVGTGCSSSALKERREQRDRIVKSSQLYCEYLNGEDHPDIDVAMNIAMGNRCDSSQPFSIGQYRTPSDIQGMMFCCRTAQAREPRKLERPPLKGQNALPKVEEPPAVPPALLADPVPAPNIVDPSQPTEPKVDGE